MTDTDLLGFDDLLVVKPQPLTEKESHSILSLPLTEKESDDLLLLPPLTQKVIKEFKNCKIIRYLGCSTESNLYVYLLIQENDTSDFNIVQFNLKSNIMLRLDIINIAKVLKQVKKIIEYKEYLIILLDTPDDKKCNIYIYNSDDNMAYGLKYESKLVNNIEIYKDELYLYISTESKVYITGLKDITDGKRNSKYECIEHKFNADNVLFKKFNDKLFIQLGCNTIEFLCVIDNKKMEKIFYSSITAHSDIAKRILLESSCYILDGNTLFVYVKENEKFVLKSEIKDVSADYIIYTDNALLSVSSTCIKMISL